MSDAKPPSADWTAMEFGAFEAITGPFFTSSKDLGPEEPFRIGFRVEPKHCNASLACHGGMIATFVDMALGLAMRAATKLEGPSPTMSMTIDFLGGAVAGDWIESRARMIHATYRTAFCDVVAIGPNGPVARANGIFRLTRPK
ncbi:MAG TPA: PaaI family thioesterase [Caulobacterales bacterium]|nr:PaaI family thioesterase [Caulobacterales bacterium]